MFADCKRFHIDTSSHLDITTRDRHDRFVRTTLQLDDDVLDAARAIAEAEGLTIGEAVSTLARRGLMPRPLTFPAGFPTFRVSENATAITAGDVRRALDDE